MVRRLGLGSMTAVAVWLDPAMLLPAHVSVAVAVLGSLLLSLLVVRGERGCFGLVA